MRSVAARCLATQRGGHQVAVVVSAMSGETNRLLKLVSEIQEDPNDREVDVIVSTGEQVSVGLVALAIRAAGGRARSFLGHQCKIVTDSAFSRARIVSIESQPIKEALAAGEIAVIAGFQGVDERGNITTLGRGGSDTTAVALAAALKPDVCEIYTDVDGVYTTDPRICPDAVKLDRISYEEMLELASLGAKVLQIRSVECASRYQVRVHVRTSFNDVEGTWVVPEEEGMEEVLVSGVAYDKDQAKITLQGVPDIPGLAAKIFGPLAEGGIVIDMIVQNVGDHGRTDLTFTVHANDLDDTVKTVNRLAQELGIRGVSSSNKVGKVSVVGLGMRNHAGVAARMFDLLAREDINIQMISTSEIKISVVVDVNAVDRAVNVL